MGPLLLYTEGMSELLYAVYPGSVLLYDGITTKTWSAAQLAAAYGVGAEPYLTVANASQVPQGMAYFNYMHLYPRRDDRYQNIKYTAEDDNQTVAYRPDFDGEKEFTMETDPLNIYPDDNSEEKLGDRPIT